jgi:hypothetical protein
MLRRCSVVKTAAPPPTERGTLPARHPRGSPRTMYAPPLRYMLASIATLLAIPGCRPSAGCDPNQPCVCTGGSECYLGCAGDGCTQDCHGVGEACGTVCGNDCTATCHDVTGCTASCGNGCHLDCHNVSSCGAICGDRCNYVCHDVSLCGVRVGPASTVQCTSVSTCDAECTGPCKVVCANVSTCNVTCLGGGAPTSCADGSLACGQC